MEAPGWSGQTWFCERLDMLRLWTHELPLKHPFRISRSVAATQPTLIVELSRDGLSGLGEATTNAYYGAALDGMTARIESVRGELERWDGDDPATLWRRLAPKLSADRFAQCAVDQAAWDLHGKRTGRRVFELVGGVLGDPPASSYTLGIDSPERLRMKLREGPNWPAYKLKLGGPDDLASLAAVRAETEAALRVDANGGWSLETALNLLPELVDAGVELIEEPLASDKPDEWRRLRDASAIPLVADESCQTEADLDRLVGIVDGVNIKLVKCGGLTPGFTLAEAARERGLRLMVGCMTESSVGISAHAQLLPWVEWADLDGAALLARDVAVGVQVRPGGYDWPDAAGCGATRLGA